MLHIRQKNSSEELTYTIVITDTWEDDLEQHPSILENPTLFEIVDTIIPSDTQYLKYQ